MPKTNDEFVLGQQARALVSATNPFEPSSAAAWAWELGWATPKSEADPTRQRLMTDGPQGHNMREILAGASRSWVEL